MVRTLFWGISCTFLLALPAHAVDMARPAVALKKTEVTQDGHRLVLHLHFDSDVKYEVIAQYAKNQFILHVPGLKFTRSQLKSGLAVGSELAQAVRGGAFTPLDEQGEIRLQLVKGITPGDVQLVPDGNTLHLQFLLPAASRQASHDALPPTTGQPGRTDQAAAPAPVSAPAAAIAAPDHSAWQPPAQDGPLVSLTGQTFADPPVTIAPGDPSGDTQVTVTDEAPSSSAPAPAAEPGAATAGADSAATGDSAVCPPDSAAATSDASSPGYTPEELAQFSGVNSANPTGSDAAPAETSPAVPTTDSANSSDNTGSNGATSTDEMPAPTETSTPAATKGNFAPGPSYKKFNLDQVPAKQAEIKGLPFREALMQLVAGSGFNVVVGNGIDNDTVYLDFRDKQISLKGALDAVCAAYQLAYTVQDDAIVISRQ